MNIEDLPTEIIYMIYDELDLYSLMSIRKTNKRHYDNINKLFNITSNTYFLATTNIKTNIIYTTIPIDFMNNYIYNKVEKRPYEFWFKYDFVLCITNFPTSYFTYNFDKKYWIEIGEERISAFKNFGDYIEFKLGIYLLFEDNEFYVETFSEMDNIILLLFINSNFIKCDVIRKHLMINTDRNRVISTNKWRNCLNKYLDIYIKHYNNTKFK